MMGSTGPSWTASSVPTRSRFHPSFWATGTERFSLTGFVLKSPRTAYRLYKREQVTSVRFLAASGKNELRKGDCITIFHLMKNLYLDDRAVGGGDGTDKRRRIKKAAGRVGPSGF
jgi:hypothetical protein